MEGLPPALRDELRSASRSSATVRAESGIGPPADFPLARPALGGAVLGAGVYDGLAWLSIQVGAFWRSTFPSTPGE